MAIQFLFRALNSFCVTAFLYFLVFPLSLLEARKADGLVVNIISRDLFNEAGKEVDAKILKDQLEAMGHTVRLFDYLKTAQISSADINIFLAQFKRELFPRAKRNWFLANPDFCCASADEIHTFDLVLCKTREAMNIFKPYTKKTYFLGFTSPDYCRPSIPKSYSQFLHVAGKSVMKGTDELLKAWRNHSELPELILIKRDVLAVKSPKNVRLITERVSRTKLTNLQNKCGFHLCPSKTEGFGHYIMEAMAVSAVVITTDAPPMNEFIHDERCLVKYKSTGQQYYATTYSVDESDLYTKIKALQELSTEELQNIGQVNFENYHRMNTEFKSNFRLLMEQASIELGK